MGAIPFEQIQSASLAQADRLLREWFPNGRRVGKEFKVGSIHGERGESLSVNLATCRWKDFASNESGYDLIDLLATKRHNGNRVAAATELAVMLGIVVNGKSSRPKQRAQKKNGNAAEDWQPMVPPPAGTPKPPDSIFSGFDTTHEYTSLNDQVTHYVGRIEARGDKAKQFIPITYGRLNGTLGWHRKAPNAPLPLYGLNRLASMPDANVILCEGEKAADAAQAMFLDYACLSWFGGTGRIDDADLAPLKQRNVIDWPDNDDAGYKAAQKVAAALPGTRILRVDDLPYKGDAANVTIEDPEAWLADHLTPPQPETEEILDLRDFLSIEAWTERDMPPPDRLLGDLVTTTTRTFLVGHTGLGKTMLALALAGAMASGQDFLHWKVSRPARVLVIDGEMPGELIRQRTIDVLRRAKIAPPHGNLTIYARDMEDQFAERFATIGRMPPLNSEEGRQWLLALINGLGGVDVIIFDNVMSLITGDQKDEVPWSDALELIQSLTARRIGQIWLDHTGHNTSRQYGSSTKAWRFDAVGIMTPLPDDQREPHDLAFTLSFEPPGKARRRTPGNRRDFETCTIRLSEDKWSSEITGARVGRGRLSPMGKEFYRALTDAVVISEHQGQTTREAWFGECARLGLVAAVTPDDNHSRREAKRRGFRKYMAELKAAKRIGVDGELVRPLF